MNIKIIELPLTYQTTKVMKMSKVINDSVMVTTEFGNTIYIAPLKNGQIQITDKLEEAEKWHSEFDATKLKFHIAATGYKGLFFQKIAA